MALRPHILYTQQKEKEFVMIILAHFMGALAQVLQAILSLAMFLIVIRAVLSWFSPDPYNPLVRAVHASTDPLLRPIQRRVRAAGGIDWSPLIALFAIMFLQHFLVGVLADYSVVLRQYALSGARAVNVGVE